MLFGPHSPLPHWIDSLSFTCPMPPPHSLPLLSTSSALSFLSMLESSFSSFSVCIWWRSPARKRNTSHLSSGPLELSRTPTTPGEDIGRPAEGVCADPQGPNSDVPVQKRRTSSAHPTVKGGPRRAAFLSALFRKPEEHLSPANGTRQVELDHRLK